MSATDELRAMLDERGVDWKARPDGVTEWVNDGMTCKAVDRTTVGIEHLTMLVPVLTPEQAIAATLGGEREAELQKALNKAAGNWAMADAELRKALDFMRIWISEDAHLGESELGAAFEKAEGLRKLGAIESAIAATLGGGKLTAEQVREATYAHSIHADCADADFQAIADELNVTLGSDAKPCYAADANYERCKYSVNRGWCDDAPFLVWDDTGHLFITMGGLKTWDVTDDARKWFATLGAGTCRMIYDEEASGDEYYPTEEYRCSECSKHVYTGKPNYCPNCGRKVVSE